MQHIKVGCLQFAPVHGDVEASLKRATHILNTSVIHNLDLLVLPELAFTGYLFENDILPRSLAEDINEGTGPSILWCKRIAQTYKCGVLAGIIRVDKDDDKTEAKHNLYNSIVLISPDGLVLTSYDKHFLYIIDEKWATEGAGFSTFKLPWLNNLEVCFGICMDINPYQFKAPWRDYELAKFCRGSNAKLLLFSSAWCNRHPDDVEESRINSMETLNYWYSRLVPLHNTNVFFVCADRVGSEKMLYYNKNMDEKEKVTFCGSSCVLSLQESPSSGKVLIDMLDEKEESLLLAVIEID